MAAPAPTNAAPSSRIRLVRFTAVCLFGSLLYVWLLSRSWVGRDQMLLLQLGERFASTGTLDPVAKGMSGGGTIPGSLLQILIGLPLMIWRDYRAPILLIGFFNLLAGIVIYRVAARQLDAQTSFIYFAIYWLSPWRLTHAAMLWEPAFLFLPAAIHFWAASKRSKERDALASFAVGVVLLITPQLHGSFLFLWILTALLVWKKQMRLQWFAFAVGAALGAITFIPMILAAMNATLPSALPSEGFFGKGFLFVAPFLKGVLYWVRLPTIDLEIKQVVYLDSGWASSVWEYTVVVLLRIVQGLETITIGFSLIALWWYIRRYRAKELRVSDLSWIEQFAWYSCLALLICGGLAPVTLQSWHVVIAQHAAMIALALWASRESTRIPKFWTYFTAYFALAIIVTLIIGSGKQSFRKLELPREVRTMPEVARLLPMGLPIEK